MKLNAAFWKWFGDSAIVDESGDPLIVYHGSVSPGFSEFRKMEPVRGRTGPDGFYFTSDIKSVQNYARDPKTKKRGHVIAAYLSIQNPLDITDDIKKFQKQKMSFGDAKRKALEKLTYFNDGVVFLGNSMNPDEIIAFYPEQIKSIDNDGTWDAGDPDIRSNPEVDDRSDCLTGKCLIVAKRIREDIGGQLYDVVEPEDRPGLYYPGIVHHVVVKAGNKYIDGTSEWTKEDLLDFWRKRGKHFEHRDIDFVLEPHSRGRAKDQRMRTR